MGQDPAPREGDPELLVDRQSFVAMDGQHRLLGLTEALRSKRSADGEPDNRAARRAAARRANKAGAARARRQAKR